MNTRGFCLAILNTQDATGYEIRKLSSGGKFSYFMDVSFGSIYPMLNKLESDGLITCCQKAHVGKPDSKIYSITQSGKDELASTMNALPNYDKFQSDFLLLSLNAKLASRQVLDNAIKDQLQHVEEEVLAIENLLVDCDDPAEIWVAEYGKTMMQAKANYYKANKEKLLELAESHSVKPVAENNV